ncbi:hypothetical protein EYF80_009842 [Liparis tanakae]|uniref:Uncharacterized protein n=1 Tax=Liparis tanakae TaxID=230148 RepID=A0A4Z2IPI7_9TELE|nr:hypothetical protein EYF80_009842 [Liparis tanakae]
MPYRGDVELIGTHLTALNSDPQRERGHEVKAEGNSANCAAVPPAGARAAGSLPRPVLTDVPRIRFCHLKTHRGGTLQTFFTGPRRGRGIVPLLTVPSSAVLMNDYSSDISNGVRSNLPPKKEIKGRLPVVGTSPPHPHEYTMSRAWEPDNRWFWSFIDGRPRGDGGICKREDKRRDWIQKSPQKDEL